MNAVARLLAIGLLVAAAPPALAQFRDPTDPATTRPAPPPDQPAVAGEQVPGTQTPAPPNTDEPIEEITVIAPRRAEPSFQNQQEYYRLEYERLRAEFEPARAREPRGDEVLDREELKNPNDRNTVRGMIEKAPRLRDLGSGN